jgi:gentisate 1,2-dioxygenase
MAEAKSDRSPEGLVEAIERNNMQPLWDRSSRVNTNEPRAIDPPMHWQWADFGPLIERAAREVRMPEAVRRVMMLTNPAFGGNPQTTTNLVGALQILEPGESAPAHRHTAAAIRFIMEANGGKTFVDGTPLEMQPGDCILTPGWTWHGHINDTDHRVVWFDGLDVPLARFSLDTYFFEPHAPAGAIEKASSPTAPGRWVQSGLAPSGPRSGASDYSPKLRYAWADTLAMLDALEPGADGSTSVQYVNPQTGGAVFPTIDCWALRLEPGRETSPHRSTSNAICIVVDGEGRSTIGERSFEWSKHDIFSIPHWNWAKHHSENGRAHLFFFSDRELYRRLAYLREEVSR